MTKNNPGKLEIVPAKIQSNRVENGALKGPLAPPPKSVTQVIDRTQDAVSGEHRSYSGDAAAVAAEDGDAGKHLEVVMLPLVTTRCPLDYDSTSELEVLQESKRVAPTAPCEDLTVNELAGSMMIDQEPRSEAKETHLEDVKHRPNRLADGGASGERGILKRQRGGCKGPCACLDCASFRLNSERAFEFSKRQMLEAEDVALGLMKELSGLRRLVAGSVVPIAGKGGYAVLQLNQVQVGDVCRRAMEAEAAARNRLREMAANLSVRCRIMKYMQHKVSFADCKEPDSLG